MPAPLSVAILWHMHQPDYRDPFSGRFLLPWVRLHALKNYYGMGKLLHRHPRIRVTFNFVPSLLNQIELYLQGEKDVLQIITARPAEQLTAEDKLYMLQAFFSAHPRNQIFLYPRFRELYEKRSRLNGSTDPAVISGLFSTDDWRDLQIWYPLSFFDREFRESDPRIATLLSKGGRFSEADKRLLEAAELDLLTRIIPLYRELAIQDRIEISTSPFYHPILPLLIDPQLGRDADPSLPEYDLDFDWTRDADIQVSKAITFMSERFGKAPAGIWPSEGSLSEAVIALLEKQGIIWTAADEENLARSLGIAMTRQEDQTLEHPGLLYRPYHLKRSKLRLFFRDHLLSDLIGFHYQHLPALEAAADFVHRLEAIAAKLNTPAVVPIILDGENPWEHYESDGRPFLDELYRLLASSEKLRTVTFSEACDLAAAPLRQYRAGSWIGGNFNIWIGAEEDRRAWHLLAKTREACTRMIDVPEEKKNRAFEHLLSAEGSDWFWWYGGDNTTSELDRFDLLFRNHLQAALTALDLTVHASLQLPVFHTRKPMGGKVIPPLYTITPDLDGEVSGFCEWLEAGRLEAATGSSMHRAEIILTAIHFGFDDRHLYMRLDTTRPARHLLTAGGRFALTFSNWHGKTLEIILDSDSGGIDPAMPWRCGVGQVIECSIPLSSLLLETGQPFSLFIQFFQKQIPVDRWPILGLYELTVPSPQDYQKHWQV